MRPFNRAKHYAPSGVVEALVGLGSLAGIMRSPLMNSMWPVGDNAPHFSLFVSGRVLVCVTTVCCAGIFFDWNGGNDCWVDLSLER